MKSRALLAVLIAAAPAAAGQRKPATAPRADARKKAAQAAAAPATAAPAAPAPASAAVVRSAPARADAALSGLGAALTEADGELVADDAFGPAAAMGLRAGDRAWRVDRGAPRSRAEAAAARLAAAPEERESLVARRGLEVVALSGADAPPPPEFSRGADDLSARERALASLHATKSAQIARDDAAGAAPLDWTLRADQAFWVKFPGGLPAGLKVGDEVAAESATGLTTDGGLDFLAVPPRSKVWARVVSASDDGAARQLRLAFFKTSLAGGRTYPILGVATTLAGAPSAELARVSAGGTLIAAAPLPAADGKKRRGKDLVLDEEARVRVRLIDPVTLNEAPSWWRAGPGLWLKTVSDGGRRRFAITHIVVGRSAAAAGLKVGDLLDSVDGRSSERLDFEDALDSLYGAPGTTVKVSVVRGGASQSLTLTRGVSTGKSGGPLALPFTVR